MARDHFRNSLKCLVPLAGLEPARPCGQQILSLLRARSLMSESDTLMSVRKFPIPLLGNRCRKSRDTMALQRFEFSDPPRSSIFPSIFPFKQGIPGADWFAADCVLRH